MISTQSFVDSSLTNISWGLRSMLGELENHIIAKEEEVNTLNSALSTLRSRRTDLINEIARIEAAIINANK